MNNNKTEFFNINKIMVVIEIYFVVFLFNKRKDCVYAYVNN